MTNPRLLASSVLCLSILSAHAEDKITYADHVRAVMENKCFSCHNPDKKKGDLDLTSYAGVMTGGGGGSIVDPGNGAGSKLIGTMLKKTEPFMPPEGAPMPQKDIDLISKWIDGGVLDTANSLAKKSSKPKLELNVAAGTGKPEGPIAKPENVLLEPVVVTPRQTAVTAMAASPWTGLLAFAAPKQILLYDTDTRQLAGVFPYTEGYARSLKFSRSGSLLVMGGGRGGKMGHAIVFDVKTGHRVAEIGKEMDCVMSADISPDHSKVVIGSPSKKVKVYDLATGEELYTIAKHTEWILATQFSPDGILLGTADRNGNVFVWEAANGGEFYLLGQHKGGACTDISWRSDSNMLASCSRDGTVIVWEMNEGKQVKSWTAHNGGVESISFTPDGNLVTCGVNGAVILWDVNGNKKADLPTQPDVATRVAALFDNKTAAVANWKGEVKLVDFASKQEVASLSSNPPKIDQRIAMSEQRAGELTNKLPSAQEALKKAEADATALDANLARVKADAAANDARKNALPGEIKAAEQAAPQLRAAVDKAKGEKARLVAATQQYNDKQGRIAKLKEQLAPVAPEAAKHPAAEKALNDLKAQLENTKKDLAAKAGDAALQASVNDLQGKVNAANAEFQKLVAAKSKAEALQKQIGEIEKTLGEKPRPVADADKAVADAEAQLKANTDGLAAKKAELPKAEKAAKDYPNVIKDAEGKAANGRNAVAAAQATLKSMNDEIALMHRMGPLLKAAKFNIGVLAEKEALAKLESDVNGLTEGIKDGEEARAAALKRIDDSRKTIAELKAKLPSLEAEAKKQFDEVQPVEKAFTATKAAQEQAAAKLDEAKKLIATKEAEVAALAKARDDGLASAKQSIDSLNKEIPKQQKVVDEAAKKLEGPAKTLEAPAAAVAKVEADIAALKKAAADAKATFDNYPAELKKKDDALTVAWKAPVSPESQAAIEAAQKALNAAREQGPKLKEAYEKAQANTTSKDKALADAKAALAAAEKNAAPARNAHKQAADQLAAMQKTLADKQAVVANAQKDYEGKAAPVNAMIASTKASLAGLEKALADMAAKVAADQKTLEAKRAEVGKAQTAVADAKGRIETTEKTLEKATKEAPDREKAIAEAKAELAKLQPQLEPQRAKVKQLTDQYLTMLPK